MNRKAAERELRVFRNFAEQCPLGIVPESIESANPPAPDILCTTKSGERIAFELVELIDQDYARGLDVLFKTLKMLSELPQRLPEDLRERLIKQLGGGAFISFDFVASLPLRDRENAAVDALRWLLDRREAIEDHNDVDGDLRSRVSIVHVRPWKWELRFDSSSFSRLEDPTIERLQAKFGKTYRSEYPIELLMYTEIDLIMPDDVWRPTVEPFIHSNIDRSPFRRVWLYKGGAASIAFVYPPTEGASDPPTGSAAQGASR